MSGLQREVVKWLQSLDLTWQIKIPKWDLSNGYLVAEIFSWYYPQEIEMHMYYNNGTSLESKLKNWSLLKNFFKRHRFGIPEEYIDGTIHCKEGAATLLCETIYEILTNRKVRSPPQESEIDFTDRAYQVRLPLHARSTASKAVKNNLRITELMADKNLILGQQKAQHIINEHMQHRQEERIEDPYRFDKRPTLGELALRRPPPPQHMNTETSMDPSEYQDPYQSPQHSHSKACSSSPSGRGQCNNCAGQNLSSNQASGAWKKEPAVQFKEVQVQQMPRSRDMNHQNMPITGY